jgi:hypothetical protein
VIVELADFVSFQDENAEAMTNQRILFPAPATKKELYQFRKSESTEREQTFSVDPEEGTFSRCSPFRELVTIDEPRPSFSVPRIESEVVIFPRVWRGEPSSNIFQQLLTCKMILESVVHNGKC